MACEKSGIHIPRFCWHKRLDPVGMCRMCLVEVETPRGKALVPSCTTEITEDLVIETESEVVTKAQEGILEFLLINHPLDCPVCDKAVRMSSPGSNNGIWSRRIKICRREETF